MSQEVDTPRRRIGRESRSRRVVEVGTTVRLYPVNSRTALRALWEWTPLISLSAWALVLREGTLCFSLQHQTGAPFPLPDTLETSAIGRMQLLLKSLRQHLKPYGIDALEGGIDLTTREFELE